MINLKRVIFIAFFLTSQIAAGMNWYKSTYYDNAYQKAKLVMGKEKQKALNRQFKDLIQGHKPGIPFKSTIVSKIESLLRHGANPNKVIGLNCETLLYEISISDENNELVRMLLQYKADPNRMTSGESTPLHRAAAGGALKNAEFLIEAGSLINAVTWVDNCPLHLVLKYVINDASDNPLLYKKYLEIAQLLLNADADLNLFTNYEGNCFTVIGLAHKLNLIDFCALFRKKISQSSDTTFQEIKKSDRVCLLNYLPGELIQELKLFLTNEIYEIIRAGKKEIS